MTMAIKEGREKKQAMRKEEKDKGYKLGVRSVEAMLSYF